MSEKSAIPPQTLTLAQALQIAIRYHQAGQLAQAEMLYRQILQKHPTHSDALHLLGVLAAQVGRYTEAIEFIKAALTIDSTVANFHNSLGNVFRQLQELAKAATCYQRALTLNPQFIDAYDSLGKVWRKQGKIHEAMTCYQRALALNPQLVETHYNLGNLFFELGQLPEAGSCYQQAITLNPQYTEAHYNLGNVLAKKHKIPEAISCYRQALALNPQHAKAHNNLGIMYAQQGDFSQALACYQYALTLDAHFAEVYANLANVFKDKGLITEALTHFRQSLALQLSTSVYSNLLFTLNYLENYSPAHIFTEHRQFNTLTTSNPSLVRRRVKSGDSQGKLKIGYISPDFCRHSVGYFIFAILTHHNRQQFEIVCYDNNLNPDEITHDLQQNVDHWVDCAALSDEALANKIRTDQIDILVDLAGHTANNRLPVLARKPAPVQMTYLGYPNTTGLTAIDYRLTDACADPPDIAEQFSSETLVRMPHSYFCYTPPSDSPPVNELPALQNNYITFGSFNYYAKLNPTILNLWIDLLEQLPNAKLLVKTKSFTDFVTRQDFKAYFAKRGLAERLLLADYEPSTITHLQKYHQVDIGLDSYPYNGATTTCEALWMGVPVVTWVGDRHAGRMGLSILSALALTECIAYTPEEYVAICVKLAKDTSYLRKLRHGLRARLQQSPLMAAAAFTKNLESLYQQLWETCPRKF